MDKKGELICKPDASESSCENVCVCECRSWNVDKKGELTPAAARDKAHQDRVTAIVWHKNFLYSVSYSGSLKMWDGNSLELVAHVSRAHEGGRIHCAAAGPDGYLYTGGDDKVRQSRPCAAGILSPGFSCKLLLLPRSVQETTGPSIP